MLDMKILRAAPDVVRQAYASRSGGYLPVLDELLELDGRYRRALAETETLRAERKAVSGQVGRARAEKGADAAAEILARANALKQALAEKEAGLAVLKKQADALALAVPNLPDASVPAGRSEADNKVIFEETAARRGFKFIPQDHHALGERLGILDFSTAALLSGARFSLLRGAGARLERALINFMLDRHGAKGYRETMTPYIVTRETLTGTGQLPKFGEDLYKLQGEPELFLIPTAEVTLTGMYRGAMLAEADLPKKFAAFSACFRQEAGTYGKDTRGLIRNHQFNKVELVWLARPEDSMAALETLVSDAEDILRALELPFRRVLLCTGDTGFSSAKTYDIEVWFPSENRFREISSCSNCTDFQARRLNTRFKRAAGGAPEFVHTLNGSGLAVGRTFAAVLENCQREDGTIQLPKALVPYFGADTITPDN
ncbi:MAG: serine--tRNA ligase [Elusimicrobiaceae bacterium]|nr:serine--tRNA ligase [Elusimicrobiaceae bacterium]